MRICQRLVALCLLTPLAVCAQQPTSNISRAETLVQQLRSTDPSVRGAAKVELVRSVSPEALQILLRELPLVPEHDQLTLLEVLAAYKDPQKIPVLISLAITANANVSDQISGQLSELGEPAARALMKLLEKSCDPSDPGGYAGWVARTIADMRQNVFAVFVAALRSANECQQIAAEEGMQRAYAEREYGLADPSIILFTSAASSEDPVIHSAVGKWIDANNGNVDFDGVVEVLIATYRANAPPATRVTIAKMLAAAPRPRVTRFMNAAIHAPNQEIQSIAREYLQLNVSSSAAAPAVSPDPAAELLADLRSPDCAKRIEAAETLGQSDDALRNSPILVDAIHDSDPKVRAAVAAALGNLNELGDRNYRDQDLSCVPVLTEALKDSDPAVRAAAAQSLGQIRDVRDNDAVSALREALKDSDEAVMLKAIGAIDEIRDPGAVPTLIDIYHAKHDNPRVKSVVLFALVSIRDPRAQPVFIDALSLSNSFEREQAVSGLLETLKKQPNPNAVQPLLKLLTTQKTYAVIQACGATKDSRAFEPLQLLIWSPIPHIRGWAADALGDLGDKRAVPALGELLKDIDKSVRISAAHALSEMSDYQAPKELLDAVHDEDSTVQIWAAGALGNSHDPKAVEALLSATGYNITAIAALGSSKDLRALAPLIGILQDKKRLMNERSTAATSLGDLGDARAVDPLIGALNENDGQLLMTAAQALGKLHDKKAIEPLKQLIQRCESSSTCQSNGAAVTFAYDALQELGVNARHQVTGSNPPPH